MNKQSALLEHEEILCKNIKNTTTRETNIELLRIVAMIMIILHHLAIYLRNTKVPLTTTGRCLTTSFFGLGKLGVNIFVLISGYFLINSKFKTKKVIKLWLQVVFYSVLIMIIIKLTRISENI